MKFRNPFLIPPNFKLLIEGEVPRPDNIPEIQGPAKKPELVLQDNSSAPTFTEIDNDD